MNKKRALPTEEARWVRQKGYHDALEFALAIGLPRDYQNDPQAKKDVTANGNLLRSDGNNQDVCWVTGKFIGIIRAFVESNTVVVIGNIHDNPELL